MEGPRRRPRAPDSRIVQPLPPMIAHRNDRPVHRCREAPPPMPGASRRGRDRILASTASRRPSTPGPERGEGGESEDQTRDVDEEIQSATLDGRRRRVMKRITIAFLFVATVVGFSSAARASDVVLATPDGRIVSGSTLGLTVGQVTPGLIVNSYIVPETAAASLPDPPARGVDPLLWGYEASDTAARILTYSLFVGSPPITQGPSCAPFGSLNGRGLAFDPMDGNLWYTFVNYPGFNGDGFIHKTTPPNTGDRKS